MRCFVVILALPGGRFHPCFYKEHPLPGGASAGPDLWRFKSGGHHTAGLATLAEAQVAARELGAALDNGTALLASCPPENVLLDRVITTDDPVGVIILRPFGGPGQPSLSAALETGA